MDSENEEFDTDKEICKMEIDETVDEDIGYWRMKNKNHTNRVSPCPLFHWLHIRLIPETKKSAIHRRVIGNKLQNFHHLKTINWKKKKTTLVFLFRKERLSQVFRRR